MSDTDLDAPHVPNSEESIVRPRWERNRSPFIRRSVKEVDPAPDLHQSLAIVEEKTQERQRREFKLSLPLATSIDHFIDPIRAEIHFNTDNPDKSTFVRDRINPMNTSMFDKDVFFQKYVDAQRDVREAVLATFNQKEYVVDSEQKMRDISNVEDFAEWLKDLHILSAEGKDQEAVYRTDVTPGKFHNKDNAESNYHAEFLKLRTVAKRLNDPFKDHSFDTYSGLGDEVLLPGISQEARPRTLGGQHIYPSSQYHGEYLREMQRSVQECLALKLTDKPSECIEKIAQFYQYAANSHLFDQINNSLFMNITNALLERTGMVGIPHDELDYAAMVLQPDSFVRYFAAQVLDAQDKWIHMKEEVNIRGAETEHTSLLLPTGQQLEISHSLPDRVKKSLEVPIKVQIPYESTARITRRYDMNYNCEFVNDKSERKTYMIFDRELSESDIGKIFFLNKYDIPYSASVIQDQDGKMGILIYQFMEEQSAVHLTSEAAFESIMQVIQQQDTTGRALGLADANGSIYEQKLAGKNVYLGGSHTFDQLDPLEVPNIWDDSLCDYHQINKEKRSMVLYLLQRAGVHIDSYTLNRQDIISRGARGLVYHDRERSAVIKTTKLLRSDDVYQMMILELYFKELMPGFPKFIGFGENKGNITTEFEFIPDLVPLNKFTGILSDNEINKAIENLKNFHLKTNHVHGDLHEENIQVQTVLTNGQEEHIVWFLDPCGKDGRSNARNSTDLELRQARDLLLETVLRNYQASS